ncbi:septal ring lytic transglycosylase RlpA family protein, partial [Streptococcus pyogenes]
MSAAHKTLPLPSYVEVTNQNNGKKAIVRVNDRGPFHNERLIDLSYAAAKKLGVLQTGTAPVALRLISPKKPAQDEWHSARHHAYYVQLLALS